MTENSKESETRDMSESDKEADCMVNLKWTDPIEPNKESSYNHCVAVTPFGRFLLTWKGWKENPGYGFDETPWGEVEYHGWGSVEEAQNWAAQEMERRILKLHKRLRY